MKISEKEHKKSKNDIHAKNQVDAILSIGDSMSKSVDSLKSAIFASNKERDIDNALTKIADVIYKIKPSESNGKHIKEMSDAIGNKIDKLSGIIENKPDSFEFDIRRGHRGDISKVIVKPIRE